MKKRGRARREAILNLVPEPRGLVVDVGADHGHVAAAASAVATERMPGRMGRSDVPWVVADGLAPFRTVDVAIIAGMGAVTISGILERGPRPRVLIAHAQDDPPALRKYLAAHGWRIDAEALAPEANRWAEVIVASAGQEPSSGLWLEWGPRLLEEGLDPHLEPHLRHHVAYWQSIALATAQRDEAKHRHALARRDFLAERLAQHFTPAGES